IQELSTSENGNFVVSPFSIEATLALAKTAFKGESLEEIRNVLHLPDDKDKLIIQSLLSEANSKFYNLHTGSKIYVKKDIPIKEKFKNTSQVFYENLDFSQSYDSSYFVNRWLEDRTEDRVTNVINADELNNTTRVVLVNGLYFTGKWSKPFAFTANGRLKFYKKPNETIYVDYLRDTSAHFNYYESQDLKAQFLELPFLGGEALMVVVLPKEKDGLSRLENQSEAVFCLNTKCKTHYLIFPA
ncbi:antichymotrypsin-2-like, partial [Tribolium castaneum]|uniref:antichymotrypsin-2-like n=1 Tax=Tribolium castaneum TaxID=7070 RepID=UPI0030FEC2C6